MDVEEIKARQAYVWAQGDYAQLARQLAPAATALCDACAVSAGQEVLDVGAGDGNFALACASEGASVVASDLSPGMVERGRARAAAEGYDVEWVEADAEDLPFEDERFDCAGSAFGAFLAPRPERAAGELFRVVRPGGSVGLTAWTPEGVMGELIQIGRRYAPPASPDVPPSERWGVEGTARERLAGLAAHLELERRNLPWRGETPDAFADELLGAAPTFAAAREALPPERFEAFSEEIRDLIRRRNEAEDGSLVIGVEYLLIVARKRG